MKLKDTKLAGFFNNTQIGKIITSAAIGAVKGVPVVGNVASELIDNRQDELTGEGKVNYVRMFSYFVMGGLILGRLSNPDLFNEDLINKILTLISRVAN